MLTDWNAWAAGAAEPDIPPDQQSWYGCRRDVTVGVSVGVAVAVGVRVRVAVVVGVAVGVNVLVGVSVRVGVGVTVGAASVWAAEERPSCAE